MRSKLTRTYSRNVQKKKLNNDAASYFTDFQIFTSELLKDNVLKVQTNLRKVLNMKNVSIIKLKEELKECKITIAKRDDQIKMLDTEKEVFNQIMYAEVEKFDGTYQNKIEKLEAEKQELMKQISEQESKLKYYEEHLAENKSKTNNKDEAKIRKIVKKCKDLKVKVKSRDFELFQKELEKKGMKKHIDVKDDEIKKRDMEIFDLKKRLNKTEANSFSLESLNKRNEDLEEELRRKEMKMEEMKVQAIKDEEANEVMRKHCDILNEELRKLSSDPEAKEEIIKMKNIAILDINQKLKDEQSKYSSLDERNKMNELELAELKSKIEKNEDLEISLTERIEELTETKRVQECEMKKMKSEQISLDESYKRILEEKDEKIRSLAERNNLMCKDLLKKQQESAKILLETKTSEISILKDELEKAVKKEQILMKIMKSKELLIRTLEEKTDSKVLTNKKHETDKSDENQQMPPNDSNRENDENSLNGKNQQDDKNKQNDEKQQNDENQQNDDEPQNDEDLINKQHSADLPLKPNLSTQDQVEGTDWTWYGKEYLRNNKISITITETSSSL